MPVIGLAVRWWDAGEGSGEGVEPPPQIKKIFLYTGSVVRVSARSSFIADLRNGGPWEWRTPGMADRNPKIYRKNYGYLNNKVKSTPR